ncbi:MAG TPA: PQQ-binding-like beta-propeller repeat protein [Gemmataceae bacterium]|nr:PQQ-binding-like beta-propeller repeat protein [Gemmataceae bacterium]
MQPLNSSVRILAFGAVAALLFTSLTLFGQPPQPPQKAEVQQDIKAGQRPAPQPVGDPVAVKTPEGKAGWKVVIPGGHPLATPAIADGKVFIGGGFGSFEFYAFDAATGKKVWRFDTGDDGPTAAVVEDGYISFNTESCELYIIAMDGKQVWKKWLGDPLMSMPAISKGHVYMAYPDCKGNRGHVFACFDVKTGKEQWTKPIAGEIITAPVIQGDKIYLTTVDGTMYCFNEKDGIVAWSEKKNATSSPAVFDGKLYFSQRTEETVKDKAGKEVKQQMENLAGRDVDTNGKIKAYDATKRPADYLDMAKRQDGMVEKGNKAKDAGVGFATAPAAAGLPKAAANLGQATVAGVWSYQGSRPFIYKGNLISTMGDTVKCIDPKTEKILWKQELHPPKKGETLVDCAVTPPAIANGKLFVGTSKGEVICLSAETGKELWRATVGAPITFQPAVANGRVYVASSNGMLFCIETGDRKDDGWFMWGGNAQHNGIVK